MKLAFTEEQGELRKGLRRLLEKTSGSAELRRLLETDLGYDPELWDLMAKQVGLQGLAIPEEYGGSGFGWMEQVAVFEEMGAALLSSPYLASVALGAPMILHSDDGQAKRDLLPGIASGAVVATLALAEDAGLWAAQEVALTATRTAEGWRLDGHKSFVLDGMAADLILVVATTPDGPSTFAVNGAAAGLTRRRLETMDPTRRLARLEFAQTLARQIGTSAGTVAALSRTLDLAAVALAAEQVGGAARCLEMSVEHAKTRIQFGQPIGTFQAIKHKCADMLLDVELARSAAYYGGWAATENLDELPVAASLAKAFCSQAYFHVAAENIQIHGGMGFTWEHDAHLYFKRAKSSGLLLGDAGYHREALAARLGIGCLQLS